MKKNINTPLAWSNTYDRHGNLTDSTPYQSMDEAISKTEELVNGTNGLGLSFHFIRIDETNWQTNTGSLRISVETTGSPLMCVKNNWVAISANYTTGNICTDEWFIRFLLDNCGLDIDALWKMAELVYEKR